MKKVSLLAVVLLLVLAVFAGCDDVDNQSVDETSLPTTLQPVTTMPIATVPEPTDSSVSDIEVLLKANLEALVKDNPIMSFDEAGFLDNHLFNEIVALGEDALPYLLMLTDTSYEEIDWFSNFEFEHRIWAVYATYAIKPETYDLFFPSPDGEYTARVIVDSLGSFYNYGCTFRDIHMIENATNTIVYETDMSNAFTVGGLFFPDVTWSEDSRFAVINCSGRRSGSTMAIDMETKCDIYLPGVWDMINHVFPGEDAEELLQVPRTWFSPESWESEKIIKIKFNVMVIKDEKDFSGWYRYDLAQQKVLEIEYTFYD